MVLKAPAGPDVGTKRVPPKPDPLDQLAGTAGTD